MSTGDFRSRIRLVARGLAFRRGRTEILLVEGRTARDSRFHHLPGGEIAFMETGRQALIREFREELGLDVNPGDRLFTDEEIFPDGDGSGCHVVSLVYPVTLPPEATDPDTLIVREGRRSYEARWYAIGDLDPRHVHPARLIGWLSDPDERGTTA